MSRRDVAPPGGQRPPDAVALPGGGAVDLSGLAAEACSAYYEAFPEDLERYGDAGRAWCDHDSRYLLAWALEDAATGLVDCARQVEWLGRVLAARDFPLDHLRRHVELIAGVLSGAGHELAAERMRAAGDVLSG